MEEVIALAFQEKDYLALKSLLADIYTHTPIQPVVHDPLPHVSLLRGKFYDFNHLALATAEVAARYSPLTIKMAGIGIFTAESPILYINIVRTPTLVKLQTDIWQTIAPLGSDFKLVYIPENWVPHITVGKSESVEDVAETVQYLAHYPLNLTFQIEQMMILSESSNHRYFLL